MEDTERLYRQFEETELSITFSLGCQTFCIGLPPKGEVRELRWIAELLIADNEPYSLAFPIKMDADAMKRLGAWLLERAAELEQLNTTPIYDDVNARLGR